VEGKTVGGHGGLDGFYFYSSRKQLEHAIKVQQGFGELEANVEQQKMVGCFKARDLDV